MMRLLAGVLFMLGGALFYFIPATLIAEGDHYATPRMWGGEAVLFGVALLLLFASAWFWQRRHEDGPLPASENTRSSPKARLVPLLRAWLIAVCLAFTIPVVLFVAFVIRG